MRPIHHQIDALIIQLRDHFLPGPIDHGILPAPLHATRGMFNFRNCGWSMVVEIECWGIERICLIFVDISEVLEGCIVLLISISEGFITCELVEIEHMAVIHRDYGKGCLRNCANPRESGRHVRNCGSQGGWNGLFRNCGSA